jgi:hypothetical protein
MNGVAIALYIRASDFIVFSSGEGSAEPRDLAARFVDADHIAD